MGTYRGIDYSGPFGTCNRDSDTGIRYGIIGANHESLSEWFWDSVESVYLPYCPHCYEQLDEDWDSELIQADAVMDYEANTPYMKARKEYDNPICPHCHRVIEDGQQWPDCAEPDGNILQGDEEGFVDSSNDIWVTKSPYFTYAQYCSPCAPGACHLENPLDEPNEANKCYCLGPDWFDDNKPPYPVYSVETGERVA